MRRGALLGVLVAGLTAGCDALAPVPREVAVALEPPLLELDAVGATAVLETRVTDRDGQTLAGTRTAWGSSDPDVATVEGGLVTARGRGTAQIEATVTGLGFLQATARAEVRVTPRVTSLALQAGAGQEGAAGGPLAQAIVVRATDRLGGPVDGAWVRFTVAEGGGTVEPGEATTGPTGEASAVWTLGAVAGTPQRLEVGVPDDAPTPIQVLATARPGPPALLAVVAGDGQTGVRGRTLSEALVLRATDAFGNGVPGVPVALEAEAGGRADPPQAVTDVTGSLTVEWTLADRPGAQHLEARGPDLTVVASALSTEVPAAVQSWAGDGQAAEVASSVPVPPAVRVVDGAGDPVPGVPVDFDVSAGGGALVGPSRVATGVDGVAAVAGWRLGEVAGTANQALRASVSGLPPRVFTASALPGAPASLTLEDGDGQTGPVTVALPTAVRVRVTDALANPVPNVPLGFRPGSGYVDAAVAVTGPDGRAAVVWTLGPLAGEQQLEVGAVAGGLPPVVVLATATGSAPTCAMPESSQGFDVAVCATGAATLPPDVAAALSAAVARWEAVIVGDLPDVVANPDHPTCAPGAPWVAGPVDDLVLYVTVQSIDGPGGGLAGAAPCFVRDGSSLPTFGRLRLDADDVGPLSAAGQLVAVLVHEIGHALGLGTLWPGSGLLVDPSLGTAGPPPDTHFAGTAAVAAFDAAGGAARTAGAKVPVQNTGGAGVADVHWRESVMGPELFTAALDAGVVNPFSAITVAAMGDLGYVVDGGAADVYVVPFPNFPAPVQGAPTGPVLVDDIWWGPLGVVDATGRVLRTRLLEPRRD